MIFQSITIRDLGPFAGTHTFDLQSLEGTVTSVMGPNGSGKTTLVELLYAGVYRTLITRGSKKKHTLPSIASGREALLEVMADGITFRHLVDGTSGKADAVVIRDGEPITSGKGVRDFDRWVAENMPAPNVVLAGLFSHQGSKGFVQATAGERKSVLLRLLGVEQLELLAKNAREQLRSADEEHGKALKALQTEEDRGTHVAADLRAKLEKTEACRDALEKDLNDLQMQRSRCADAFEERAQRQEELGRWDAENGRVDALQVECMAAIARAEQQQQSLDGIMRQEEQIRQAAKDEKTLGSELISVQDKRSVLLNQHANLKVEETGAASALKHACEQVQRADEAKRMLEPTRNSVERLLAKKAELDQAMPAHQDKLDTLDALQELAVEGVGQRVEALRGALEEIKNCPPEGVSDPALVAEEALQKDDAQRVAHENLPERLKAAKLETREHARHVEQLRREVAELPHAQKLRDDFEKEAEQQAAREEEQRERSHRMTQLQTQMERLTTEGKENTARMHSLERDLKGIIKLARNLPVLESAARQRAALKAELAELQVKARALQEQLEQMPERPEPLPQVDLRSVDDRLKRTELDLRRQEGLVSTAVSELSRAEDSCVAAEELRERCSELAEDCRLWRRLSADLGKDGLQASVVDAALPRLVESANNLLHTCFGNRFSVELTTQSADAKGEKMLETLDVVVHDAKNGRVDTIESYSGGEVTVLSEAVSLSIAQLMCINLGLQGSTLIRDEAGGALDPQQGPRWVEMMRKAAQQVGFQRVLFISHDPGCQALGDSRLELQGPE